MHYIPNTDADRAEMLARIGVKDFEALISQVPETVRFRKEFDLPRGKSEMEVSRHMGRLAGRNKSTADFVSFLGGGAYDHYIPAAVKHIVSRSEFVTCYTPYQPEVSQGTLQAIYEYQSMICELSGMDAANASMYDGGSALGEAALMAHAERKRPRILVSEGVHPLYRHVIKTYTQGLDITIEEIPLEGGLTPVADVKTRLGDDVAALIVQTPNFYGIIEGMQPLGELVHEAGGLFVVSVDPISLALLSPPGEYGADIVTGEGQSLGNALNFGGPYLGIFATTKALVRKMPGRLAGKTVDARGRTGFVLTLQTREQHIRRERATSNICTNQALNALTATVYMALMGKQGLRDVAEQCAQKSHYLAAELTRLPGVELLSDAPFFKEFALRLPTKAADIVQGLKAHQIFAGVDLAPFGHEDALLVAVTEKRTKAEMDDLTRELGKVLG